MNTVPVIRTPAQRRAVAQRLARLEDRLGELMTLRADLEETLGDYDRANQAAPTQPETPAADDTDAR